MGGVNGDGRGKKRGRDSGPHSFFSFFLFFCARLSYCISRVGSRPVVLQSGAQSNRITLVSFVNTELAAAGERMAFVQNYCRGGGPVLLLVPDTPSASPPSFRCVKPAAGVESEASVGRPFR